MKVYVLFEFFADAYGEAEQFHGVFSSETAAREKGEILKKGRSAWYRYEIREVPLMGSPLAALGEQAE